MKLTIIIVLLSIGAINLYCQGAWTLKDRTPTSVKYRSIDCYDSLNCVALGNQGWFYPYLRLTSDGGATWKTVFHDTVRRDNQGNILWFPKIALDVAYPDSNLIFILCDTGIYYYSTNKGMDWIGPVNLKKAEFPENWTSFYNSKIGGFVTHGAGWITYDSCKTFTKTELSDSLIGVNDISIPDSNIIFLLTYRAGWGWYKVIKSIDRGKNWTMMPDPPLSIRRIFFFDSLNGFGYGGYRVDTQTDKDVILRTRDGGNSWEIKLDTLAGLKNQGLIQMSFSEDRQYGVAMGYKSKIYTTRDSGETWIYNETYFDYVKKWPADVHQLTPSRYYLITQETGEIWEFDYFGITSVDNPFNFGNSLSISPNPAADYIEISVGAGSKPAQINDIHIFDILGMELKGMDSRFRGNDNIQGGEKVRINVSALAPGIYFVRVEDFVGRFVKY